ncbi:hypothetical protein ACWCQ1_51545 [Streptomyces sp. NPDC002144]|uniref:hypothetical protein n=1 Tax=Bacilli TaxID=91061 RepID=UPI00203C865E|nr:MULTISPECIES: hypothetical protein [Bacilli]MCM3032892.1 hypothetical protein [Niallia sp. MER 6]MDK8746892.1 hypothetical protein [Streptococcus agalactiae]
MSVILIHPNTFERAGKFFKAWKGESDERIAERLSKWESYNRENYERRYSEKVELPLAEYNSLELSFQPLISPEQMLNTLNYIKYQCCDYSFQIDRDKTLKEIEKYIEQVESEFQINQALLEHCSWG